MNVTKHVMDSDNKIIKVSALAGTGKTTTAKHLLTQYSPDINWLVLVFNKDNKDEWRKWKQKHAPCSMGQIHSYASFVMATLPGMQWDWICKPSKSDYEELLKEKPNIVHHIKTIVDAYEYSLVNEITIDFVQSVFRNLHLSQDTLLHYVTLSKHYGRQGVILNYKSSRFQKPVA